MVAVSAGDQHSCALTTAGGVKCWGHNGLGELGDGTTTNTSVPVGVVGLGSGAVTVSAGNYHSCALTTAGGVKCWGASTYGALGDGITTTCSAVPVGVVGLSSGVVAVSAGTSHSCALTTAGGVKRWGTRVYGALGDGTTTNSSVLVDVFGLGSGRSRSPPAGITPAP